MAVTKVIFYKLKSYFQVDKNSDPPPPHPNQMTHPNYVKNGVGYMSPHTPHMSAPLLMSVIQGIAQVESISLTKESKFFDKKGFLVIRIGFL